MKIEVGPHAEKGALSKKPHRTPAERQEPKNYNFSHQASSVLRRQRTKKATDKVIVNISPISQDSRLKPATGSHSNNSSKKPSSSGSNRASDNLLKWNTHKAKKRQSFKQLDGIGVLQRQKKTVVFDKPSKDIN